LQLVFVVPALLLLILAIFQYVVWEHGTHVAAAAAEQGLEAARVQGGSDAAGVREAQAALAQLGPSIIRNAQVRVVRSADTVRVEVTGTSEAVLPGVTLTIAETVEAPIERFGSRP